MDSLEPFEQRKPKGSLRQWDRAAECRETEPSRYYGSWTDPVWSLIRIEPV